VTNVVQFKVHFVEVICVLSVRAIKTIFVLLVRVVCNLTLEQLFTEPLTNSNPWRAYHFHRRPMFLLPKVRPEIGRYQTPQGQNFSPESRKIFLFAVLHDIRKNIALLEGFLASSAYFCDKRNTEIKYEYRALGGTTKNWGET